MRELGNDLPLMGNSHEVTAHHFILDLDVDMDQKVINGIITLFLKPSNSYRQICSTDFVVKKDEGSSSQEQKKKRSHRESTNDGSRASERNTPVHVSDGNSFSPSSSNPETDTSRKSEVSDTKSDDARTEEVGTSSVDHLSANLEKCCYATNDYERDGNDVACGTYNNLDSRYRAGKDCRCQADSETHHDFQLILDCCDIDILQVEEVCMTQNEMKKKTGRIERNTFSKLSNASKSYSGAKYKDDILELKEGYNSNNRRQDTFEIFSRLMTDSKQNSVQESKATLHNDESLEKAEIHADHTYCYNSAQSSAGNCRTTTLTATPGENTITTEEFHNDHDYYTESKKIVLQRTSKFESGSNCHEVARVEQATKDFETFEKEVSRRECCVPELRPTASKIEAKEVLTTFMGIHNCPSGRPLHHRVDPWCVRIWREGVRDRQSFPRVVRIKYRTTPEGGSLTWVTDQDGKPCVFTQGSCINNRSLFPCHDFLTMATWQAVVHAPHGATVLMSGEEPGATWQPEAVAWQPDAVTKQPDTGIPVVKQTDSTQEEEFVSTAANELTSSSEQMHGGVASVAKQCDVAKQQADTEAQACSDIASRDHHYFYVTMPMPCSTLALAVGYWLQASSEESTTQEQNRLQPSIQSEHAQEIVSHPQPDKVVLNCCKVVPQRQFDADDTTQHVDRYINPPTLPSMQVTTESSEQYVDHTVCSGKDHVSQIPEQASQQKEYSHQQSSCCKLDHVRVIPHRVFAPSIHVQQAGREFLPLIEKYLSAAYDVLGPHPLPRLDVLMVPRCFASLGLASPHLMMVSQSLLAGDGSMCLRLAHEIAHSWFGLLIGSRDWTEEWISEGFATYLEDCIHAKAMGWTEREGQEYSDLRASIRYRLLSAELDNTEEELQTLRPSASGQGFHQGEGTVYVTNALNTDKLFTQVHYLKGYFLLRYFAKKVGAEKFHSLLKSFVQEFPRHGMNLIFSQDFFNLVFKTFPSLSSQGLTVERIYQDWVDCPGLPKQLQKNPVNASNKLVKQVKETLKHWKAVDRQNRQSEREARKMTKTRRNQTGNAVKRKERRKQSQSLDGVCGREESMDGKNAVVHDGKRSYDVSKCLTDPDFSPHKNKCQAVGNDIPNKSSDFECSEPLSDSQSNVPHRTDLPVTSLKNEGGVSAHDSKAKEPGKGLLQDQLVLLLEELLEMNSVAGATLQQLEERYSLSRCNADVRHRWCELVIKHGYSHGYKDVQRFLCEDQAMGVYLYGELMGYEQPEQQQLARETFKMLSQEMEEGPRKAVQEMLYGDLVDEREMGV